MSKDMTTWTKEELSLLQEHLHSSIEDVCKLFPDRTFNSVHVKWKRLRKNAKMSSSIEQDSIKLQEKQVERDTSKKYKEALKKIQELQKLNGVYQETQDIGKKYVIKKKSGGKKTHATIITNLSDVHAGSVVTREQTFGLNEYNLDICEYRVSNYFRNLVKLIRLHEQSVTIDKIILFSGGDNIDGYIHEENVETNLLSPIESILWMEERMIRGIEYLLENTEYTIDVPIVCGNHSRITDKIRHANVTETSLETILAHNLTRYFKNNKRVNILFNKSNVVFINTYGKECRFEHGHTIKFSGGVGGFTVPVYKAINNDNITRHTDYTFFGHFHSLFDGGRFHVNGSVVGYNKYAIDHHIPYEEPKQMFCMIDDKGRKINNTPIFLDE